MQENPQIQGPLVQVLSQEIVICPQCKGSGTMKQVTKTGEPVIRHGNYVTQTCNVCLGAGRMGKVVKAEYYTLPQMAEVKPEQKRSFVDRVLDKMSGK